MKVAKFTDTTFVNSYIYDTAIDKLIMACLLSNREATIKSVTASINLGDKGKLYKTDNAELTDIEYTKLHEKTLSTEKLKYSTTIERVEVGKQNLYMAACIHEELIKEDGKYFISWGGNAEEDLYFKLLQMFSLPLLKGWSGYIYKTLKEKEHLEEILLWYDTDCAATSSKFERAIPFRLTITEDQFMEIISTGLKKKIIRISDNEQKPLEVSTLDDYFMKYGSTAVSNLMQRITPRVENNPKVNALFKKKRHFPRQAMLVNALTALLLEDTYGIVNAGMGCGKTFMTMSTVERHCQELIRKKNPDMSLSELTKQSTYRAIIMAPGHLLRKWESEILDEIPLAKTEIITDFSQIERLSKKIGTKPDGKYWYIISKDFCKLDYQRRPAVRRWGRKTVTLVKCSECGDTNTTLSQYYKNGGMCTKCNATDKDGKGTLIKKSAGYKEEGWLCPGCGEILYPANKRELKLDANEYGSAERTATIGRFDFEAEKTSNSNCRNCGTELWTPNVQNIQEGKVLKFSRNSENPWKRITHWINGNKKTTKTLWVHSLHLTEYLRINNVKDGQWSYVKQQCAHKISPAAYIKKVFPKDFFDYFAADEAHLYKGGGSAQGHAFHTLYNVSKKRIILTGTLMGGVAKDLFYLLFRADPKKFIKRGYTYEDVIKFSEDYGVLETEYTFETEDEYKNTSSKGVKRSEPKVRPGISPLIFAHFLFENTLFMDLNELSAFLPKFTEKTIRVDMCDKLFESYSRIREFFRKVMFQRGGRKLIPTMVQTLLSYPDKPYGFDEVRNPETGHAMYKIPSLDPDDLYPKEKALIDLINKEYREEDRMCFVYTTFTGEKGDKDVTPRLKEIIEKHCELPGQVAILRSNTVKPIDREKWLDKAKDSGMKVIICNPKLVETGLDLLDYPTLIFYQTGYSLFTLWQASRRSFRLNQKNECRVYYMAYKNTLQDDCLQIMAEKKTAQAAIQGQFTSEGLAAMAQGVNPQIALAQALSEGSFISDEKMDEMFNKINEANNIVTLSEEDKAFLAELENEKMNKDSSFISSTMDIVSNAKDRIRNLFDMFSTCILAPVSEEHIESDGYFIVHSEESQNKKKRSAKVINGQIGLSI